MSEFLLSPEHVRWLLDGMLVTFALALTASALALVLGFGLCIARLSGVAAIRRPAMLWLSLFRNTPLLVQLFIWYFGASSILPADWMAWLNRPHLLGGGGVGIALPSFEIIAGFTGLTLYTAAFMAEEFRAGINAVAPGQVVAGRALGFRPARLWLHVILPQAIRNALSPLAGQVMNAIKNSSLAMAIGVAEISYQARRIETETFQAFQSFGAATLLYILLIGAIELLVRAMHGRRAVVR